LIGLSRDKLRDEVGELLGRSEDFSLYGNRLADWCAFTDNFLGRAHSVSFDRPWRADVVDVEGLQVGVLSLCTAWASGSNEKDEGLLLGERQLCDMIAESKDAGAQLVFALMHHPIDSLHEEERSSIRGRLERDVDFVLHGHTHEAHSVAQSMGTSTTVTLSAGAAYAKLGQDPYHGFSVGRLDGASGSLEVHHFTWSTSSGKWHEATGTPGADEGGVVRLNVGTPAKIGPGKGAGLGHEVLATRLRHAAARVYATFDLAGLGVGGPRKHVTLDKLFVPLDFKSQARREGTEDGSGEGDAGGDSEPGREVRDLGWLEESLDDARRFVLLGDPGSGKSTLCKYLAVSYARREEGPVPLLLTVRDWIAEGGREGLLEMAARQARRVLSVSTDESALEGLCSKGRVLLIIDGVDEAADPAVRRQLRDRVHGFASTHPHVPMLVTSRYTGYEEVPLDDRVFEGLTLEPFDDDAIELFVRRWYEVTEPSDPVARMRKREDLMHALDREPRAKALARNPLLATLIAMVHFSHAQLPGDRAKLYGSIVELLLITWPADRNCELNGLHGSVQQSMLERLALRLQDERAKTKEHERGAQVLVELEALEQMLADLLREHAPEREREPRAPAPGSRLGEVAGASCRLAARASARPHWLLAPVADGVHGGASVVEGPPRPGARGCRRAGDRATWRGGLARDAAADAGQGEQEPRAGHGGGRALARARAVERLEDRDVLAGRSARRGRRGAGLARSHSGGCVCSVARYPCRRLEGRHLALGRCHPFWTDPRLTHEGVVSVANRARRRGPPGGGPGTLHIVRGLRRGGDRDPLGP